MLIRSMACCPVLPPCNAAGVLIALVLPGLVAVSAEGVWQRVGGWLLVLVGLLIAAGGLLQLTLFRP